MNRLQIAALAAVSLLCAACEKAEIATYRVAKVPARQVAAATAEPAPASPTPAAPKGMANTAVPTASGSGLAWTAPDHWKSRPATAMRRGSFGVPGDGNAEADLSITAFPGDVGGELANVNRWRGQIQLEPITEADLPKALTRIEKNGLTIALFDAAGPGAGAQRTLGAMIPFNGATWFFKLTGPDALVVKERAAFMAFLESIKPATK